MKTVETRTSTFGDEQTMTETIIIDETNKNDTLYYVHRVFTPKQSGARNASSAIEIKFERTKKPLMRSACVTLLRCDPPCVFHKSVLTRQGKIHDVWSPALNAPLRESENVVAGDATSWRQGTDYVDFSWEVVGDGRYILALTYTRGWYDSRYFARLGYNSASEAFDAAHEWLKNHWSLRVEAKAEKAGLDAIKKLHRDIRAKYRKEEAPLRAAIARYNASPSLGTREMEEESEGREVCWAEQFAEKAHNIALASNASYEAEESAYQAGNFA